MRTVKMVSPTHSTEIQIEDEGLDSFIRLGRQLDEIMLDLDPDWKCEYYVDGELYEGTTNEV